MPYEIPVTFHGFTPAFSISFVITAAYRLQTYRPMSKSSKINNPHADWIQAENVLCSTGRPSAQGSAEEQVYLARMLENDGRKSEALAETQNVTAIQRLRTMIQRGKFAEAIELLVQVDKDGPIETPEVLLEEARIKAFSGQWTDCFAICQKAVSQKPTGLTLQTIMQVRSLALFELGDFSACARDLDLLESMSRIYPSSQASLYARITMVKLLAVKGELRRARRELNLLWQDFRSPKRGSLDFLLVLLRAESCLSFCEGGDPLRFSQACGLVARTTGEDFYGALALMESANARLPDDETQRTLANDRERFSRLKLLQTEIDSKQKPISTSAAVIRAWKSGRELASLPAPSAANFILLENHNVLIQLQPFQIHKLSAESKLLKVLAVLAKGRISKEVLFRQVWEMQNYVPHLHENLVFQTIGRVRRTLGVAIDTADGHFQTMDVFLL